MSKRQALLNSILGAASLMPRSSRRKALMAATTKELKSSKPARKAA